MKTLIHTLFCAALSIPLILAQTSNSYLETFDSGNAEGWAFYTGWLQMDLFKVVK